MAPSEHSLLARRTRTLDEAMARRRLQHPPVQRQRAEEPGRNTSPVDLVIEVLGALIGAFLALFAIVLGVLAIGWARLMGPIR